MGVEVEVGQAFPAVNSLDQSRESSALALMKDFIAVWFAASQVDQDVHESPVYTLIMHQRDVI